MSELPRLSEDFMPPYDDELREICEDMADYDDDELRLIIANVTSGSLMEAAAIKLLTERAVDNV